MSSNRQNLERLLRAEAPDTDFSDDEALYAQVISDYEDYARLLTLEHELQDARKAYDEAIAAAEMRGRNAAIQESLSKPVTDGMPHLGGASPCPERPRSYFDLARF